MKNEEEEKKECDEVVSVFIVQVRDDCVFNKLLCKPLSETQ